MDILGYLLFGILLVAAFSPNWVGEWLAKVRQSYETHRDRMR